MRAENCLRNILVSLANGLDRSRVDQVTILVEFKVFHVDIIDLFSRGLIKLFTGTDNAEL